MPAYPPTCYDDLDQVMLEEGESKYIAISISGRDDAKQQDDFKPVLIRGYKGCNFYGEILERFVREELSVMECAKGKYTA